MSTSIIDGTVADVVPGRRARGIAILKSIRFDLADGSSRTVTKAVVTKDIAAEIVPGAKGRFYLYNAFDMRGIHGVRTADGRAVHGFPTNNQTLFLVAGTINLAWVVIMIALRGAIPLLGAALLVLCAVGWYFMGRGKDEARKQFDGDAGYVAPPVAAAT